MHQQWEISKEESSSGLLAFLKQKLPHYSGKRLKQALDTGCCRVNNRIERFGSFVLGTGDLVSFHEPIIALKTLPQVLWEDDDFLVLDKTAGVTSESLQTTASLAHRLDKETSGVLIFTKTEFAKAHMFHLFKNRLVAKCYLAFVDGVPQKASGTIHNTIGVKCQYEGQSISGEVPASKGGQEAITEWKREQTGDQCALLRCYPKTGRTHQIRVHLSSMGHPILGDAQYGKHFRCPYHPPRILLHAESVKFTHPRTERICEVKAPIPTDFIDAMKVLLS